MPQGEASTAIVTLRPRLKCDSMVNLRVTAPASLEIKASIHVVGTRTWAVQNRLIACLTPQPRLSIDKSTNSIDHDARLTNSRYMTQQGHVLIQQGSRTTCLSCGQNWTAAHMSTGASAISEQGPPRSAILAEKEMPPAVGGVAKSIHLRALLSSEFVTPLTAAP